MKDGLRLMACDGMDLADGGKAFLRDLDRHDLRVQEQRVQKQLRVNDAQHDGFLCNRWRTCHQREPDQRQQPVEIQALLRAAMQLSN